MTAFLQLSLLILLRDCRDDLRYSPRLKPAIIVPAIVQTETDMRRILITLGLMLNLGVSAASEIPDSGIATADEVVAKVERAVALMRRDEDAGLDAIADPSGEFVWKDTYIFVVDCEADRVVVNPAFPERVGGDIKQHTDYAGYQYGLALCETAAKPDGGWIDYVWLRPGSSTPIRKSSYVRSVPGTNYQLGAGIYGKKQSPAVRP